MILKTSAAARNAIHRLLPRPLGQGSVKTPADFHDYFMFRPPITLYPEGFCRRVLWDMITRESYSDEPRRYVSLFHANCGGIVTGSLETGEFRCAECGRLLQVRISQLDNVLKRGFPVLIANTQRRRTSPCIIITGATGFGRCLSDGAKRSRVELTG